MTTEDMRAIVKALASRDAKTAHLARCALADVWEEEGHTGDARILRALPEALAELRAVLENCRAINVHSVNVTFAVGCAAVDYRTDSTIFRYLNGPSSLRDTFDRIDELRGESHPASQRGAILQRAMTRILGGWRVISFYPKLQMQRD